MDAQRLRLTAVESRAISGTTRLLEDYGNAPWAEWITRELAQGYSATPYIVVVGEVKRGKSSLVNALVGSRVTPSGADVVTAGFVHVVPPSPDLAEGQARLHFPGETPRIVPMTEVASWITDRGSEHRAVEEGLPTGVVVSASSQWLPGVILVDTPGVGGMNSAHAEWARIAAQQASALLFVTDGGQVLTAPELRFLTEVSRDVESVTFAVTKIDRHPTEWREVMAENRALLAQHAPRFASPEVFPVSAALALQAIGQADVELRELLQQASGIPALADALAQRVADSRSLHLANVLRGGLTALDQVRTTLEVRKQALDAGPQARSALEAERARLQDLKAEQARWPLELEVNLGRLRQDTSNLIRTQIKALKEDWSARIARERMGLSASVAQQRAAELESALAVVASQVAQFYYQARAEIAEALLAGGQVPVQLGTLPRSLDDPDLEVTAKRGTSPGLVDPSLLFGAIMGFGLGAKLGAAGVAALGVGLGPLVPLLGVGAATGMVLLNLGFKGIRAGRQELSAMLNEAAAEAQVDLQGAVEADLREVKRDLVNAYRDHLEKALSEVNTTIAALDAAARQSATQAKAQVTNIERQIAAVDAQREELALILDGLLRPVGASGPPSASGDAARTSNEAVMRHG